MTGFTPLEYQDGYLPIADHGLIGDGTTAALVARDGAVVWLCLPRFDSPPVFCRILDHERGGAFSVAPEGIVAAHQYYEPDTAVLVTEMRTPGGLVRLTDALVLRSGARLEEDVAADRGELVRLVEVLQGPVTLHIDLEPRAGGEVCGRSEALCIRPAGREDIELQLSSNLTIAEPHTRLELQSGARLSLVLRWDTLSRRHRPVAPDEALEATRAAWRQWIAGFDYDGPRVPLVRRSAITLKLLNAFAYGPILAAPTSSLPEWIGGPRNWDYRYSWVRDTAYAVYALSRIGMGREAFGFLGWVLDAFERHGRPSVLYTVDGDRPPPERVDPELRGYRSSPPVRWGNAAADQIQHDIYGEILDCAYIWQRQQGALDRQLWTRLVPLITAARVAWDRPDQGIWEVRTPGRVFTYSAALCQVALERGARLAVRYGYHGETERWRATADEIVAAILRDAWDPKLAALTANLGGGPLDASLLTLPLRRLIPAEHPKMVSTVRAIQTGLGAGGGLIYRYLPQELPDGLHSNEGAFLICSFWLVDNLAMQGRVREAHDLFETLCDRAGEVGLLPEEIDPTSGAFLGNYPQAFSHVGLISSGVNLARLAAEPEKAAVP
ncbi:MAG TPA: glycoside hydrolase family 15 protein [Thermomicrobiaceae bacterium]|nr:glycoside hydrolase family 15 protein [Thermomicrobiaceae bacterium]